MRSLLFAFVFLAACSALGGQDTLQTTPPETLDEARTRWQQRGFSDYQFRYTRFCFCAPRKLEATVTVRGDAVVAFTDLRGDDQPLDPAVRDITVADFPTVRQLFEAIEQADPGFREVTYDAVRGFPAEARLGNFALDGGIEHTISRLEPLR